MSSIPYSRYLFYPVTWYSFLIVMGASLALFLSIREEKRTSLSKDTVLDLALRIIPAGIIGARIYYVVFSFSQFQDDLFSVFRIWEGGLAIYGGVIAGFLSLLIFCRRRRLPVLLLCDIIAPGLCLAQSIGRWGNWFNIEAYGFIIRDPSLCFFPMAVQVPADGYAWHLATFFYESLWDFLIFLFLTVARRRHLYRTGDVFFFYLFLYAAGRLVIEELRTDSLLASSVRISQLLSAALCLGLLLRYWYTARLNLSGHPVIRYFLFPCAVMACMLAFLYSLIGFPFTGLHSVQIVLFLACCSVLMISGLFFLYTLQMRKDDSHADDAA